MHGDEPVTSGTVGRSGKFALCARGYLNSQQKKHRNTETTQKYP